MFLLTVIPIARGITKDSLSYFTPEKVPVGTMVTVPVRGRSVYGLVIGSKSVRTQKQEIKALPYAIKKIDEIEGQPFLLPEFMETIEDVADYFAGTPGAVLSAFIPKTILENTRTLLEKKELAIKKKGPPVVPSALLWEGKLLVQGTDYERFLFYKGKIREAFAQKGSVFFCVPTSFDVLRLSQEFAKGIGDFIITLHSRMTQKEIITAWKKALAEPHPILIIATGNFLSLPRKDVKMFIVDKESSSAYKQRTRPFVDIPRAVELFAEKKRAMLIVGDITPKTESIYEKERGTTHPGSSMKYKMLFENESTIVDMSAYRGEAGFQVISNEVRDVIARSIEKNERTFLYVARKGLAPYTICDDCGHTLLCKNCNRPLVLYKKGKKADGEDDRVFICHGCGKLHPSETQCFTCASWRLTPLGVGIEKAEKEIHELFPDASLFVFDADTATTPKKRTELIHDFLHTPGAIMLGTEIALAHLNQVVETVAIISIDPLFAIPDYRIHERVMNILMKGRSIARNHFIIQTRNPEEPFFTAAMRGDLLVFYREEIAERKVFHYPPFTVLIKIRIIGKDVNALMNEGKLLREKFTSYMPTAYPSHYNLPAGKRAINVLLRVPTDAWPDASLITELRALPPEYIISVNPEEIL
jgi:primosomal protein N' (replication factor Y)